MESSSCNPLNLFLDQGGSVNSNIRLLHLLTGNVENKPMKFFLSLSLFLTGFWHSRLSGVCS